ncbi:MAG: 50S ribosomal protein L10 [Propionibacteriaceae bacterium]|jgi:large subunit ribosomal protein L10|nr:50S ribosomal protein L10 [Propionibacteriaceae bacterium]
MARPDKVTAVESLTNEFSSSAAAVLTEYRGLSVKHLKELRRSLGSDASYAVAKNTLTKLAAENAGIAGLDDILVGPTAIAFIKGDVATVAKGLRDFAKANPLLVIKGGVMDGKVLDADTVKKLADLESREVLLSKLAGAMKGTAQKAVSLFAAPLTQAAQLFGALQEKRAAGETPDATAEAVTPSADATDTSAPDNAAPAASEASDVASAPQDVAVAASNE